MLDLIIEPMQYGFMQRALAGVGPCCHGVRGGGHLRRAERHGLLGRRHRPLGALTGMAAAFLFGVNVFLGALLWAVPASLAISLVSRRSGVRLDAVIGVLFAGGFALGDNPDQRLGKLRRRLAQHPFR